MNPRAKWIREALERKFDPEMLEIGDDSHKHVGHAGARDGKGHFSVTIVDNAFSGVTPIRRHRMVYDALGTLMETDIHALSIDASSPEEL